MGNSFAKNYDCPKEHTATAGRDDLLWRIWPGKHKETKAEASIWVFDKSDVGKKKTYPLNPQAAGVSSTSYSSSTAPAPNIDKAILEQVLHIMKRDMLGLKELTSTGKVVQFIELIEESKGGVIFCTERIICSLADIVDGFEHIPGGKSPHREYFGEECVLSELEIARGISNIAESLQCIHNVHRKLHMNITPASIVLTASGEWKLCGLGFSLGMKPGESSIASPYFLRANPTSSIRLEPDLCYCAPEVTGGGYNNINNAIRSVSSSSDMFSLGVVAYELFYLFKTNAFALDVIRDPASEHFKLIPVTNNNTTNHPMALERLSNTDLSVLPAGFTPIFRLLISNNAALRMTSADIVNSSYFTIGPLATLRNLDSLMSKDLGAQSSLLALLPSQLSSFSSRLLENSVLIPVCKACLINPNLWTFAIPVHDYIVQYLTRFRYRSITGPFVRRALEDAKSVDVMHVLLKNVRFFLECFSDNNDSTGPSKPLYIADAIVSVFSNSLDKARHPIQILALQLLCDTTVRHSISVQSMVTILIPKICKEACKNQDPNVKLHALYLLSLITNVLDKQFIIDNILPSLRYIIDHDKNTTVAMAVVGNYEAIADVLGTDYVALAILPAIIPLLADRTLDFKQTDTLIATITLLLKRTIDMRSAEMAPQKPTWAISIHQENKDNNSGILDPFSAVKKLIEKANMESADIYKSKSNATAIAPASSTVSSFKGYSTTSDVDSEFLNSLTSKQSSSQSSHSSGGSSQPISISADNVSIVRVKKAVPATTAVASTSGSQPLSSGSFSSGGISKSSINSSGSSSSGNGIKPLIPTSNPIAASASNLNSTPSSFNINNASSGGGFGFMNPSTDIKPNNSAQSDIDMSDFLQSFGKGSQTIQPLASTSSNNLNFSKSSTANADSMYDFLSNSTSSGLNTRAPTTGSANFSSFNTQHSSSSSSTSVSSKGVDLFGGLQLSSDVTSGGGHSINNGNAANNMNNMNTMNSSGYGVVGMGGLGGYNGASNSSIQPNNFNQYPMMANNNNYNHNLNHNNSNNNSNSMYSSNNSVNSSQMYNSSSGPHSSSSNIGNLSKGYMPPKF